MTYSDETITSLDYTWIERKSPAPPPQQRKYQKQSNQQQCHGKKMHVISQNII